ncbi:MAG: hypothetical protein Pg6C_16460 [Treponemataceae bacterium]|nr:MAG: hypothetical protein Pg6C_16460 [Treponemataceae bacterium]
MIFDITDIIGSVMIIPSRFRTAGLPRALGRTMMKIARGDLLNRTGESGHHAECWGRYAP